MKYLNDELPLNSRYYIEFKGPHSFARGVDLVCYHALPARRTQEVKEADLALLMDAPRSESMFVKSEEWQRKTALSHGIAVFERRR